MSALPFLDAAAVTRALSFADAIAALEGALRDGLDPAAALPRQAVPVSAGELLLMPAEAAAGVGVKIASVAPGNPGLGRERIQALFLLMDAATLTPRALLDGTALTTLRTPALSAVAAAHLAAPGPARLVLFGSGPQAWGHAHALAAVRELEDVVVTGRSGERAERLAARLRAEGFPARAGSAADVSGASLIACATTARAPLFDAGLVREDAVVLAVGSHEADAREVPAALVGRAQVVVEDAATALREAGDVILAIAEGELAADALVPLAALVRGEVAAERGRPRFFKSVGMGWQDLVTAQAAVEAAAGTAPA